MASFALTDEGGDKVADIIFRQLGGNEFLKLSGGSEPVFGVGQQYHFLMRLPVKSAKNSASKFTVFLEADGSYTLRTLRIQGFVPVIVETKTGVYASGLREAFTEITGLKA